MKLKVLHLISGGDTGGAKTHIFSLMKGLEDICDVKIICFIEDTFYKEAKELGINIEVLEQKSRADMSITNEIQAQVERDGYDIVHCHGARANTVAFFLKSKIRVPMVTTIHSDYELDFKDNFYKRIIFTRINKIALKSFDYYIAITKDFKSMLIDRGFDGDRIYVIYNGIDTSERKINMGKEEFLDTYGIPKDFDLYIGQAARMDNVKNISMTIETARTLKDKGLNIAVILAGDGDQRRDLEKLAHSYGLEDMVYFLGYVEDNYSFFNAIDINILTSLSESFPYAILEAAIMKVPSIATNVGGISEQITNGEDGFLVEVDDYEDMASKIEILYRDENLVNDFSQSMYDKVVENFSVQAMARKQYEIYKDILTRSNADDR